MKENKRKWQVIVALSMLFAMSSQVFAVSETDENITPKGDVYGSRWIVSSTKLNYTTEYGDEENFYQGDPAARDGEIDTISGSIQSSHTYSGTLVSNLKSTIEASIGYTFGTSKTYTFNKQSATLKKGEYVYGYATPYWSKSKVIQELRQTINGIVTTTVLSSKTCYPKKSTGAKLRLAYFTNKGTLKFSQTITPTTIQ